LIPFLHANRESIVLGEYRVEIENDLIKMFEKTETSFQNRKQIIAGEELQAASVLSFSSAFRFLFTQQTPPFIEIEQVKFHSGEHTQKELFKVLGWGVMLFFLSVLLVNFLVFDHYHTKGNNLEARYSQNKEFLDYIGQMKMKLAGKKAFVEQSGLQFSTQTSFYADRIAKDLPENIQLSEISINPLAKKIKTGEPIVFQQKNIKVKGHCVKSAYLNDWMHVLKKYEWIKDVAVINYKQDLAAEPGEFEINIQIN
jgi:Tfp pilus assembly protein PilN